MKQSLLMLLTIGLFAIGLAGCSDAPAASSSGQEAAPSAKAEPASGPELSKETLLHRHFALKTADGVSYADKDKVPTLEFQEGFRVVGGICNRFTGQGELEGDTLFAKHLASTKMLCVDQDLNALENAFGVLLNKGAKLSFDGKLLVLRGDGHELVYEVRDLVQ